jgi:hypothetical protein
MLNNSIGAPTPKIIPSETKTPVPIIIPEWVHCEICKRREHNGTNNTRLTLAYCHPCGHMICRDCAMQTTNGSNNCKYIYVIHSSKNSLFLGPICSKSTHMYPINANVSFEESYSIDFV